MKKIIFIIILTAIISTCVSCEITDPSISGTGTSSDSQGVFSDREESEDNMIYDNEMRGYLMSFFVQTGTWIEKYPLRFAYSTDGYNWTTINEGNPFTPLNGRDPHIFRKSDDSFIITTSGWGGYITIIDTEDLCQILAPRKVYLGPKGIDNTWAPECFTDPADGKYMLIYTVRFTDETFHCIYYTKTNDFISFSESKLLLRQENEDLIDASMFQVGKDFYLLFKNDHTDDTRIARSDSATGPFDYSESVIIVDAYNDGPSEGGFVIPSSDGSELLLYYDLFMNSGHWGLKKLNLSSADILDPKHWEKLLEGKDYTLPETSEGGPRHGNAIPVTGLELKRILEKWGRK